MAGNWDSAAGAAEGADGANRRTSAWADGAGFGEDGGGGLKYDDDFVNKSQIGKQIEITQEQELKDSYGNILKTKKGINGKIYPTRMYEYRKSSN